jgi:hypothetical protein
MNFMFDWCTLIAPGEVNASHQLHSEGLKVAARQEHEPGDNLSNIEGPLSFFFPIPHTNVSAQNFLPASWPDVARCIALPSGQRNTWPRNQEGALFGI